MNLFAKIGLTEAQLKLLKRVAILSTVCCIALVLGAWCIQQFLVRKEPLEIVKVSEEVSEVTKNEYTPLDEEAHRYTADHLLSQDQPEKAIAHLHRLLAFKKDRSVRIQIAEAYLDAGYYQKAYNEYYALSSEEVQDSFAPIIMAREGITLFYLGKTDESLEILKKCLDAYPKMSEAACFIGQIYATREAELPQALNYLQKAIGWDSSYVEGWYQLARYDMSRNNYVDSRIALLRALEIDPLHVKSHSRLGMVYYYSGNLDLAKKSYQTALALNPFDFNTHYNLGELYYAGRNDLQNAFIEFTRTLDINPSHIDANFKSGLICMSNAMYKEAIRYFDQALLKDAENIRIILQMAVAYEKLGDKQSAIQSYTTILSIDALNNTALQKIKLLNADE